MFLAGSTLKIQFVEDGKIPMKQQCFCQSIRFTFDGQRVTGADTAASLGLEEGDTIEVFQVPSLTTDLLCPHP